MEKARRFLAVLLTICMVFSTQSVTLWASEIPQEETALSDDSTADEALVGAPEADELVSEEIQGEEPQEEQLLGAGQVALTDVTATITAKAPSSDITNMDRGGSFALNVAYTVKDDELPRAKQNLTWTYDLSQLVSTSPISDVSGSGNLYDGTTRAGTFSVIDNIVYLYIDEDYIEPKEEGVQGTFQLNLSLDAALSSEALVLCRSRIARALTIVVRHRHVFTRLSVKFSDMTDRICDTGTCFASKAELCI